MPRWPSSSASWLHVYVCRRVGLSAWVGINERAGVWTGAAPHLPVGVGGVLGRQGPAEEQEEKQQQHEAGQAAMDWGVHGCCYCGNAGAPGERGDRPKSSLALPDIEMECVESPTAGARLQPE